MHRLALGIFLYTLGQLFTNKVAVEENTGFKDGLRAGIVGEIKDIGKVTAVFVGAGGGDGEGCGCAGLSRGRY